jgi:hypothetical protein
MRKIGGERYAYSFFRGGFGRVAFGGGVLLLPPAQETVDPAHVVSGMQVLLCHSCSMQVQQGGRFVSRQALFAV